MPTPYFDIPLNLPHAGTVAGRIAHILRSNAGLAEPRIGRLIERSETLVALLAPCQREGDNPAPDDAELIRQRAAAVGRLLVDDIAALNLGDDRLGQCIRNLFECLEMGEEGAVLSLRAGENPRSLLRAG